MEVSVTVAQDMTKYAAFASMDVEGPLSNLLRDLDFRGIIHEKCEQFMDNSRHWFFDEIRDWSRIPIVEDSKRKLFWLMDREKCDLCRAASTWTYVSRESWL